MECTQKLQCTQELYETHTERVCPEQIGFLGICGAKHPVLRGPNKIGRDPQTCSIVLNLNSVSRQHAVINVLNSKEFMLMDLDSANKTKLLNKTLPPYIPHPLKNGDTVQFGDIFGIFRLLEEDDDLPMTQAIDIPETPVQSRYVSKLNKVGTTIIPESPEISDRDESFLTPAKTSNENTRLSSGQFIKPFGKKLSLQRINSPKTDASPISSKQSNSFNNHSRDLEDSSILSKDTKNNYNIYEMNTQLPYLPANPTGKECMETINTADTQIPIGHGVSPSIHNLNTQIPTTDHLPQVRKIDGTEEMQFDIYAANKENVSIFNAETQPYLCEKGAPIENHSKLTDKELHISPKTVEQLNKSDEHLLFDEIDDGCFEDFNSQPLLPQESPKTEREHSKVSLKLNQIQSDVCEDVDMMPTQKVEELNIIRNSSEESETMTKSSALKRVNRINSDSLIDSDDIATQIVSELPVAIQNTERKDIGNVSTNTAKRVNRKLSDSSTDCEDDVIVPVQNIVVKKDNKDNDLTDCEEDLIEIKTKESSKNVEIIESTAIDKDRSKIDDSNFEEMNTQIIEIDENTLARSKDDDNFEDQPTQIIDEIIPNNMEVPKKPIKEIISPFKIPLPSPLRIKSKDSFKIKPKNLKPETEVAHSDLNYYNATQDILDDLCTQRDGSPILMPETSKNSRNSPIVVDDEVVPCSVEDYKVGDKFAIIENELSPTKSLGEQAAQTFAASLSSQEVRDVIGVALPVDKVKKFPSDSSEEYTPIKERKFVFTDSDLPNSQEIENNIYVKPMKSYVIESSSDSETELNTEDQFTPIVHKKKKPKTVAKIDLTKRFDVEKLPERIITRIRKPTSKIEESSKIDKNVSTNILKSKFITEQEDQIDEDIIKENVKRLKTYGRAKSIKDIKNYTKTDVTKSKTEIESDQIKSEKISKEIIKDDAIENTGNKSKEKIKVKIEKPKKKDASKEKKPKDKEERSRNSRDHSSSRKSKEKAQSLKSNVDTDKIMQNDTNVSEVSLQSCSSAKINTRSTRGRKKGTDKNVVEKESKVPENNEKASVDNSRRRTARKREPPPKESTAPEVEIRRSRRQAIAKEKSDSQDSQGMQVPKSILKKSIHEQSTVYNVSSSSGSSPKTLKRSLADDSEAPNPKKTRNILNNNMTNVSLRATPARIMKTHHVLFTAFPSEEVKHKLEKLGAVVVTKITECSVVLTMQVKRTFKLLCAVGLGKPIVGPAWVQACVDTHMIVDPWLYLIKDDSAEKRFQFNLEKTLNGKRNFLKGYNVSSTPSVQPNATEMKLIVECSGGVWKEGGPNWVCVSSTKDQALWPSLRKRGATVVTTEFILGGVLRQKIEIIANKFP